MREDGPLRGEQPKKSPVVEGVKGGRRPVAGASVWILDGGGQSRQQWGRAPLPPEDLRPVLHLVDLVWARLERLAARRPVEAAARSELTRVEGFAGRTDAPQAVADRLTRRPRRAVAHWRPDQRPAGLADRPEPAAAPAVR
ncbi:hypothetical protein [Streptomyces sp. NPDC127190]|uniref:hypothetical protein n=1 Tax=unclassified Streptomyces TaxID=2593676 RepID=UPI003641B409